MRFSAFLVAGFVFAAGAFAEPGIKLPPGGQDFVRPGFALRTPGAGWRLSGGQNFWREPASGAWENIEVKTARLGDDLKAALLNPWPADRLGPKARVEITETVQNGARCALQRITPDAQQPDDGRVFFRQVCAHPEFPHFAVVIRYKAASGVAPSDEVFNAVAGSLRFTPLPYRVAEVLPDCRTTAVTSAGGALWAGCDHKVVRIDPATNAVSASVPVADWFVRLAALDDALWALSATSLSRIDLATNQASASFAVPGGAHQLVAAGGRLWLERSDRGRGELLRIDPIAGKIDKTVPLHHQGWAVAAGDAVLHIGDLKELVRIDAKTGEITDRIALEELLSASDGQYDGRMVWLNGLVGHRPALLGYDARMPKLQRVHTRPIPVSPIDYAWWDGEFCALIPEAVRCYPKEGAPREVPIGPWPLHRLHVIAGSLWVEYLSGRGLLRIDRK